MSGDITTIEIHTVMNFTQGTQIYGATIITDRRQEVRGLTKGRKLPMLVNDSLPGLLKELALIAEHHKGTLAGMAEFLDT